MLKNMDHCKEHILNFTMPYLNGKLHFGHAYLATQGDAKLRLSTLLFKTKSIYMFPFHATGLPILQRLQLLKNGNELVTREFSDILKTVNIEKKIDTITLQEWLNIFQEYIKKSIDKLNTLVDWNYSHTTTNIDLGYSSFVTWYANFSL